MLCLGQSGYYDFTVVTHLCPIFRWSFCTFAPWNLWIYFEETCRRGKQHLSSSISPRGQASIDELDPRNAEILAQFKVTIERISSWIERSGMYCMMFFVTQNVGKKCFCQQVWVTQRFGGVRAAFEVSGYPELIKMLGLVMWRRLWDWRVMSQITMWPAFDFRDDGEMMSPVLIIINLSTCPHVQDKETTNIISLMRYTPNRKDSFFLGATSSVTVCYWLKRMYRRIAANSLYSRELQLRALLLFLQGDRFRFDPLHHQCRVFSGHDEVWVHETQQAATWICWLD